MPTTNNAGFVTPNPSPDDNVNHTDLQAIADRLDAILSARTAAQLTAFTGTDLYAGRRVRQSDGTGATTRRQSGMYVYSGTQFVPVVGDGIGGSAFTPTLTASTTNPNLGTSPTATCDFWLMGGWVSAHIRFVWGTGAPTPGTGTLQISLPLPVLRDMGGGFGLAAVPLGTALLRDSSVPSQADVIAESQGDSTAIMWINGVTTPVTGASPLTLGATGDSIEVDLWYPWRDA